MPDTERINVMQREVDFPTNLPIHKQTLSISVFHLLICTDYLKKKPE